MRCWPHASARATLKPKPRCAGEWRLASGSMVCGICDRPLPRTISFSRCLLKVLEALARRVGSARARTSCHSSCWERAEMTVIDLRRTAQPAGDGSWRTFAGDLIPAPPPVPAAQRRPTGPLRADAQRT